MPITGPTCTTQDKNNWSFGMNNEMQIQHEEDSVADSIAAVVLIVIFVATCLFWVSGQ